MNAIAIWGAPVALVVVLAACSPSPNASVATNGAPGAWSEADVDRVLDLRELGELSLGPNGTLLVGGKSLDLAFIKGQAYGRTHNLLGASEEVLNAVPIEVRDVLLFGTADELRAHLATYELSVDDVRAQLQDGQFTTQTLQSLARLAAKRTGNEGLLQSLGVKE